MTGAPSSSASLEVGAHVGPYRLVRLLGEGTGGRVFEVEHETIRRRAAMKVLTGEQALCPDGARRLVAEALAVNRIESPHIVQITDIVELVPPPPGEARGGVGCGRRACALVMELLEGQSLAAAMAAQAMSPARFLPILAQVCRGLAAAHAAGFVHRDLKPDNVFLVVQPDGPEIAKLLDFGLAKRVGTTPRDDPAFASIEGTFAGTPAYAAPEQAHDRGLDHRADIYSVGVILYELLAGRLPFEGPGVGDFLAGHLDQPPPPLPTHVLETPLGRALAAITERCLEKRPEARFSSASELADILEALAAGEEVPLATVSPAQRFREKLRGGPSLRAAAGIAVVVAFAASLVGGAWRIIRESRAAVPATAGQVLAPTSTRTGPITLFIDSTPAGAEARLVGTGELLGVTPLRRALERADGEMEIELSRPGYLPHRVSVGRDASHALVIRLNPSAAARERGGGAPERSALGKRTTLNPYRTNQIR